MGVVLAESPVVSVKRAFLAVKVWLESQLRRIFFVRLPNRIHVDALERDPSIATRHSLPVLVMLDKILCVTFEIVLEDVRLHHAFAERAAAIGGKELVECFSVELFDRFPLNLSLLLEVTSGSVAVFNLFSDPSLVQFDAFAGVVLEGRKQTFQRITVACNGADAAN